MSEINSVKQKTFVNLVWRLAERFGSQGVSLFVAIYLARLLSPNDYGLVALITVFINILNAFIDSGLGRALIQKKNADDVDFSSVFYFNIGMCAVIYTGFFFAAPLISSFYDNPALTPLVRVVGLTLIISGLNNIQNAFVSRHLLFKRTFYSTIGATIISAIVGVIFAKKGFGPWALVAQQLTRAFVSMIILWFTVRWRPILAFSWMRLKGLLSYGWKLLVSALLDVTYSNIRQLFIGKLYTPADLAFYNKADQFPHLIGFNINNSIDSVLLPVMSREQDDPVRLKNMTRRAMKTSTYIMAPFMMGLAFTAPVFIELLLTEKWLPCVPFLQIFCITYMFFPVHTANLNAITAMGRSDLFLKLEIVKKVVGLTALFSTVWISVMAMAYSLLVTSVLSQIINSWPNRKLLNYNYLEQLKDILPGILLAVFMGVCISFMQYLPLSQYVILPLQILAGSIIYISISKFLKLESFEYILELIKTRFKRKKA